MILIIDNYDSFTYNLVQMIESQYKDVIVIKNDELTVTKIFDLKPKGIILSPGPSTPDNAGICLEVVKRFYDKVPILGICLGHQVIAQAFGGKVIMAKNIMHGKVDKIQHNGNNIFSKISDDFLATRYHSLIVDNKNFPKDLSITARSKTDDHIMGIKHNNHNVIGLQFHPESYKTENGNILITNFINLTKSGGEVNV